MEEENKNKIERENKDLISLQNNVYKFGLRHGYDKAKNEIKTLELGEIIKFKGREWVLNETAIGGSNKKRPTLTLLNPMLQGINRKSYFKRLYKQIDTIKRIKETFKAFNNGEEPSVHLIEYNGVNENDEIEEFITDMGFSLGDIEWLCADDIKIKEGKNGR